MNLPFSGQALVCAHVTHIGCVRRHNEDNVRVAAELGLAIVADGVGGQAGGGMASRQAVKSITRHMRSGEALVEAIRSADRDVAQSARLDRRPGPATTVVAAQFHGTDFRVAWVGDSRAYRIGEAAEALTHDHSVVNDLLSGGKITHQQASTHPMRHVLTRVLGGGSLRTAEIDTCEGHLAEGEFLLLCSDGLHGVVDALALSDIIRNAPNVSEAAQNLLSAALERGGPDNIALVLIGHAAGEA